MFKKLKESKKFITGIIIGSIISSTLFGFAQVESIQAFKTNIKILIKGKELKSDVPPVIIDGRTMLPLRAIADNLNLDIGWDGNTNTVSITEKVNTNTILPTKDIEDIAKSSQSSDPKTQFVSHVEKLLSMNSDVSPIKFGAGWAKRKYIALPDYSYDIQKTDSLVSPYTAVLNFSTKGYKTNLYNTEEEALQDKVFNPIQSQFGIVKYRYHYAYQDNQWVFKFAEKYVIDSWDELNSFEEDGYYNAM